MTGMDPTPKAPLAQREPATMMSFVIGVIGSVITVISQVQSGQVTWWAATPVLVFTGFGVLVRFGVVSPATAARLVHEAKAGTAQIATTVQALPDATESMSAGWYATNVPYDPAAGTAHAQLLAGQPYVVNPDPAIPGPTPPAGA